MQDGVAGSLSSGMHHAKYNEGCGACTFNGLVFAALVAIQNGAKRVLVLDLDAHCGGGTHDILKNYENVWIADVSTHPGDFWRSTSSRHILKVVDSAEKYSQTVKKVFEDICFDAMKDQPVTSTGRAFDLIIYNAGMDVYEKSNYNGIGLSKEIIIERERMVFNWAKGYNMPIMFALAGGYIDKNFTQEELTELHRLTIAEAAKK
jgi:acetoin utilization deacetylase AcuC-like enzyme